MRGATLNRFTDRQWQAVLYARHLENVRKAAAKVDSSEPDVGPLPAGDRKWQIEEKRRDIESKIQNQALIRNLESILCSAPRVDIWNLDYEKDKKRLAGNTTSCHSRDQDQLARDNAGLMKRLMHAKSEYSLQNAEKHYERVRRHKRLLSTAVDKAPFDVFFAAFQRKQRGRQRRSTNVTRGASGGHSPEAEVREEEGEKKEGEKKEGAERKEGGELERLHDLLRAFGRDAVAADARVDTIAQLNELLVRMVVKRSCASRQLLLDTFASRCGDDLFTCLEVLFTRPVRRLSAAETWSARIGSTNGAKKRVRMPRDRKWVDDSRLSVKYATFFEAAFFDTDTQAAADLHEHLQSHDAESIVRTFCTRDAFASLALQRAYQKKFDKTVCDSIRDSFDPVNSAHGDFLRAVVEGTSLESGVVDDQLAISDAYFLDEASSLTDAVQVLAESIRSSGPRQFAALPRAYKRLTRIDWHSALSALPDATAESGRLLLTAVSSAFRWTNWSGMQSAELLHATMHPNNLEFVLNLFRLADIGALPVVRHAYKIRYGRDLAADIEQKCRGDVQPLLAALALRGRTRLPRRDSPARSPERGRSPAGNERDRKVLSVYSRSQVPPLPDSPSSPLKVPLRNDEALRGLLSDSPYLADGITKDTVLRV